MSEMTLEQFRDYLQRRAHEASQAERSMMQRAHESGKQRDWELHTIANARCNLYRELGEIIDRGEFPK